jgi:hypothetical protein
MKKPVKVESVIKNYGIMWRRDHIFWGRGTNRGTLEGRRSARIVDFREQIGIYVLYDETRRPIYAGQAGQGNARLFVRLRKHTVDHLAHRWHYVSWFGLLPVNAGNGRLSGRDDAGKRVKGTLRSTLNEIEGVLIAATEPAFNKQGARFRGIAKYHQVKHARAAGVTAAQIFEQVRDVEGKLSELLAKVEKLTAATRKKRPKA